MEFNRNTTWRRIAIPFMLVASALIFATPSIKADQKNEADSAYTFRFVAGKDMFYSPWGGNGAELSRLLKAIDANREAINDGSMYLHHPRRAGATDTRTDHSAATRTGA